MTGQVSVITACKDRLEALSIAIQSWIPFEEIKEIIVVDWDSKEDSSFLCKLSPKVTRVYVPDQKYFNQPEPLNLAFSICSGTKILKLDSDTILNPYCNFFEEHPLDDYGIFYSGLYSPAHKCYRPLWGNLYTHYSDFEDVGGYNENMGKYVAWEDDELVNRLLLLGTTRESINFNANTIFALPHENKKRIENFEAYHTETHINDKLKKMMEEKNYDVDSNIDYAILSHHTILNSKKFKRYKGDDYHVKPKAEWNKMWTTDNNLIAIRMSDV